MKQDVKYTELLLKLVYVVWNVIVKFKNFRKHQAVRKHFITRTEELPVKKYEDN